MILHTYASFEDKKMNKIVTGLAAIALASLPMYCSHNYLKTENYSVRVVDKEVKTKRGDSMYLVSTKSLDDDSVRVFRNQDTILKWKWNSSDVQGKLEVGKTYDVGAYGWRIPILSKYENITSVTERK
jgi:hypothetical protein